MCGIAGIFNTGSTQENTLSQQELADMAAALIHRGPDAEGFYIDGSVGFAHRRLSIIDLSGGSQPMQTIDGNIVVTFNGEIFNFIELRMSLMKKGYSFQTHSDTEVILHLYCEFGLDFPKYLNGQFAIGLWDRLHRKLVLARDRLGICPLYYSIQGEQLIFASEIKALLPILKSPLEIDPFSLDQIFTGWTCLPPYTVFKGLLQVEPGELISIDIDGARSHQKYWDFEFPESPDEFDNRCESEIIEELHDQLLSATEIRLRADVPVAAYLSGGLDSSVLVSLMHKRTSTRLKTFSLGFDDKSLDESEFQNTVVNYLGTQHSRIDVNTASIAHNLPKTLWHTESPILRTAPVPMGMLSKLVHSENYRVVLTGEGADEVLGGYDIFKEAKVRQFWAKQPDSQVRPQLIQRLYPYLNLSQGKSTGYLQRFFGVGIEEPELLYHSHLPRWQTTSKAKVFFSQELKEKLSVDWSYHRAAASMFPEAASQWNWLNRAQYLEIKSLMAGYLLTSQGDRMLARNSVEGRFPYLDHRLIEFANRVPAKLKIKALQEKYILKKMAKTYLPGVIRDRNKQPYRAPDVAALTSPKIPQYVYELLSESYLKKTGLFNALGVSKLLKKLEMGKLVSTSDSQALVGILSTQLCHALFIGKCDIEAFSV